MLKLFGRERPIHEILGSGKVADILLWRNKAISGAHFIGMMGIWFLFEVAEYNLVTFFCHVTITTMLVVFIWSNGARAFNWTPPNIPVIQLEESMLYKDLCEKVNFFMLTLINIACGNDIIHFCLTLLAIELLAMIGNYVSTPNLLFIVLVCMGTHPHLYEKHEAKVESLVDLINQKVFEIYKTLNENIISKIPKWPKKTD
ncbi:reticulon-like protein B9 [Helianthus annuus]|uniref:reticulon-like protein B9 n=1 Tax=Helianthus annuus TaxID=4232 RepID=UPI000B8EEDAB|nr:reticulon-like protein B9 [Helianthus annuus]